MIKKTILCIDDIDANLFTLKSVLESEKDAIYNIITVDSAQKGFEVLLKQKIDLILLDIMMPDIDGFEATNMIKSNKKTKNIPIIFVTAKSDDATVERCFNIGGADYIKKPINSVELLSRVMFHLKLQDKENLLLREKEYTQSILDLQENIILVTDSNQLISANRVLLNFFGMKSVFEFQKNYKCICNIFEKEDGYFHLGLLKNEKDWVEELLKLLKDSDVIVKIVKESIDYIFAIKATKFHEYYILTLTDITHISEQSLAYEHDASYDALTQVFNRNMLYRLVDKKILNVEDKPFILIILDIDFFKNVNDNFGHLVGDAVLKHLCIVIEKHIRQSDIFARYGGEEFVLVLDVEIEKGVEIANSLRKFIEKESFDVVKSITCSFGITQYKSGDKINDMLKRADEALYEAKENGRNMVCMK